LLSGNEFDIENAIIEGNLFSPQHFENVWLFDVRVTGTGTSYRTAHEEYVYRPPENFLSDEFVQRCNGLPVIFEHPEKSLLTTEEYRDRAIGTIVLPYATDTEVRGIAKIYDEDAAHLMMTSHASTSPAVVFRAAGSTESIELDNGESVLIEGKPSYIDHLAICENGVWDKGNGPTGINLGETTVSEETKVEKRDDAEGIYEKLDALMKRVDAIENKGGEEFPTETMREDKKRKDAEKEEAEKKEAEAVKELEEAAKAEKEAKKDKEDKEEKADSQSRTDAELRSQIASLNARITSMTAQPSIEERDAMAAAQARADQVARLFGDSVTAPLAGESSIDYRKRLASRFQKHCKKFSAVRLDALDGAVFDEVERTIYADAQALALSPSSAPEGRLIPVVTIDAAGRNVTRFHGDPMAWMKHFMTGSTTVRFNKSKEINS